MTKLSETIGVAVGRFQVHTLHKGHRHLIDEIHKRHERVLILVGSHEGQPTDHDPLSYAQRCALLREAYPDLVIREICDQPSDDVWSDNLDMIIKDVTGGKEAILYGSRDSFFPYYSGKHRTHVVKEIDGVSGTTHRKQAGNITHTEHFRRGVIHAVADMRQPTTYTAVNIALLRVQESEVLLCRKASEIGWRFPGVFVSPTDTSLENAAQRVLNEVSSNIVTDNITYINSRKIDDPRFANTKDDVLTTFFTAAYVSGAIGKCDDCEVLWCSVYDLKCFLCDDHQSLGTAFIEYLKE